MLDIYYIDANIFIYLADKTSEYSKACVRFFEESREAGILLATSVETIQEIVYVGQKLKSFAKNFRLAKYVPELVDFVLPVSQEVLPLYFELVEKYKKINSADLMHTAVMLRNNIRKIVTFDKDFLKIKEVEVVRLS